jgi:predicted small lipoprotein YifL
MVTMGCSGSSSPPLAGGGRGLAPAGAHGSASASVGYDRSTERYFARCRAQTPPPSPSRKGRGRFVLLFGITVAVLALSLSACGKKGAPEPPDPKTDQFPRQYPDPSSL